MSIQPGCNLLLFNLVAAWLKKSRKEGGMNKKSYLAIAIILTIALLAAQGASAAQKESFGAK